MFVAYSDASVRNQKAFLAFVIIFEDKSKIRRRIVVDESDNNIAEALALSELLSFLKYHNLTKGIILFDSNGLKCQLKKKKGKIRNYLPKNINVILRTLEIRTQVIPRKYNIAHRICYLDKCSKSNAVSEIDRAIYSNIPDFPQHFMQFSVLEEYRQLFNKHFATFHEAQMKLNKKIWLADLIEDMDGVKLYAIHDKRIKVVDDTIVKISKVNYVQIGNHWRVTKRGMVLKKLINVQSIS